MKKEGSDLKIMEEMEKKKVSRTGIFDFDWAIKTSVSARRPISMCSTVS